MYSTLWEPLSGERTEVLHIVRDHRAAFSVRQLEHLPVRATHKIGAVGRKSGALLVELVVPCWYRREVDINVKSISPEVVERLREQAEAENMSQQEWIRQVLARAAGRLSPAELLRQRQSLSPMSEAEFEKAVAKVSTRRQTSAKSLRASQRRS
jgi:hypothetical protein